MTRYTQEQHWDHERDLRKHEPNPRLDQRHAVAALVGQCEAIAASGQLAAPAEQSLRLLIAKTLTAFDMPAKSERTAAAISGVMLREPV
jgi:hypothetical protein